MELKSCPFCGSDNVNLYGHHTGLRRCSQVICNLCGSAGIKIYGRGCIGVIDTPVDFLAESKSLEEAAINAWNTRPDPWISVEDRLPEESRDILIYVPSHKFEDKECFQIQKAWMDSEKSFVGEIYGYDIDEVTHWMPLPDAPKEEK